ncbi:hypothetical protein SDC9_180099 [bioreactor metagenome]|uniref:Uncharacterized protein n=1 Tax=bioreactor metagenome TaxID=1076179 RepID=A0A645H3P9_9ZZZZ
MRLVGFIVLFKRLDILNLILRLQKLLCKLILLVGLLAFCRLKIRFVAFDGLFDLFNLRKLFVHVFNQFAVMLCHPGRHLCAGKKFGKILRTKHKPEHAGIAGFVHHPKALFKHLKIFLY